MTRLLAALSLLALACGPTPAPKARPERLVAARRAPDLQAMSTDDASARPDPHSLARPDQVRVTHVGLRLRVDPTTRSLGGEALLQLDRVDPRAPLRLDTRGLTIVEVAAAEGDLERGESGAPVLALREAPISWAATTHRLEAEDPQLGRALVIDLPDAATLVRVRYEAAPEASGLQWLEPAQTAGRQHPFLYSQSQAIHGRTWIPCQDSPGARVTYDARVEVPAPLVAVMAAELLDGETPQADGDARVFRFAMPQRVPAYLIALAVGDLARAPLSERTAVWADPAVVAAAAHEFADLERMVAAAEALYGPYAWGRYDLLVLPPAFPFGGMENPRMTFATPTILAGDRSLVSLVAHELAHSWSGNLVTNATWSDLWLNEGFTVYFERRIVEALYGPARAAMEAELGLQDLERELVEDLAERPGDQRLRMDLAGRDPDANFTAVPYEKGALLLTALERAYGREVFDAVLRAWFTAHRFGAVTTADFEAHVTRALRDAPLLPGATAPSLSAWLDGAGLPADAPRSPTSAFAQVDTEVAALLDDARPAAALRTGGWTPHHWLHFLRALPRTVSLDALAQLDDAFHLTQSANAEVLTEWLTIAARRGYAPAMPRLEAFLVEVGRRKFLVPLYRALLTTPEGAARARAIYARAR
ncbi:MAG: M1 family metallopeptidase, partial [Myxococcales bacterium]|nr:M1 family metallopeptidase [Myxococcales bacterium]